jgi:lysophospholipase L1-like esterase
MAASTRTTVLHKLALPFISVVLVVLCAELIIRLVGPDLYYADQTFPINRDMNFIEFYQKDHNLFWRLRTDQMIDSRTFSDVRYRINSRGMRGDEIPGQKDGCRVVALGNSCTFGWGVEDDKAWVKQLELMLKMNLPNKQIEVINCGVPGYSSYQGREYFSRELLYLDPDILLIMFGWNDHWVAGRGITDDQQTMPGQFMLQVQDWLSHLDSYRLMRKYTLSLIQRRSTATLDDLAGPRRVPQEKFRENLRAMISLARENSIEPVLLVPPIASLATYLGRTDISSNFHLLHSNYQADVILVSQYEQVQLINLQVEFDRHNDLFDDIQNDPIHFNTKGHLVAAETIGNMIAELIP